ncbi:TonB-linked outer membrane protein, SusC/RagA family [Porphyromonadaceae bacterium NLAE-zl-C104]|nr:TonB-linked outer membrane protein, SusC/RagA family [Porphyromonadaceae bacterium NLAE-zl-C104]
MKINSSSDHFLLKKSDYKEFIKIMKICLLFLFAFTFQLIALNSNAQDAVIEIKRNSVTIGQLINEIEKQTDYLVVYSNREVDVNRKVKFQQNSDKVSSYLNTAFSNTDIGYNFENDYIVLSKKANQNTIDITRLIEAKQQQGRTVTGKVTDENGEPVIGATIVVKDNPSQGTITDIEGNFNIINLADNAVLQITYVGMRAQEINTTGLSSIRVTLESDTELLEEIVVVGYGTMRKRDLTGSIGSVNSSEISKIPVTNAAQALQGKVAGVLVNNTSTQPGATPSVFIRGKRSISGGSDPLYVVDGIPIIGGLNEISPTDIETIDVLKDASATAIYGARGSNGVIMITTKKGKEGKTQVDYNGYYGIQTVLNELKYMNAAEFAETVRESFRTNGKYKSEVPSWEEDQTIGTFRNDPYTLESLRMAYDANGNYDPSKVRSNSEWWKAVQRTGMVTSHELNIRGGNAKTNFMTGGTYYKEKGLMKDEDFTRFSIRINLEHEINKYFKVGAHTQFARSIQNRGASLFSSWRVMPMGRFYDDEGNLLTRVSGTDDQWWNPLQKLAPGAVVNPYKVNRFMGSYFGEIRLPIEGLRFRSNLGLDMRSIQDYNFQSALARASSMNYAKNATADAFSYTWENLLFYDKTFNDHTLGLTFLQSIQEYKNESNGIPVQNIPADELLYYDVGSALIPGVLESNNSQWSLASFMGRANYSYKGKYMTTLSMRYDGSSRLSPGHQWVMFPAASFAWRINDESFMRPMDFISNLKLRLGYGTVASQEVSPYETKGTLSKNYYNYGDLKLIGYAPNAMPNNRLTWEKTGQWNVGIDFGFFNQRINGSFDIYLQNTTDLLLDRQLPVVSGFDRIKSNIGKTRNKGVEISLNTLNISNKDFSWSTDWMFYINKEEIVELYNGKIDDPGNNWFIGKAINVFYDYQKIGIWQNTEEDLAEMAKFNANGSNFKPGAIRLWDNGDYKINSDDRRILGQARPKVVASISNNFTFKDFDLSFFFMANFGGMIKNDISYLNQAHRNGNVKVNYWTPNNPTNDFPRPIEGVDYLDYYVTLHYEKSDFVRLRNVTLGYTLPKDLGKKLDLSRCRIYLQAQNPWIWTNFKGVDPEGASGYTRPSASSWIIGLNLSF